MNSKTGKFPVLEEGVLVAPGTYADPEEFMDALEEGTELKTKDGTVVGHVEDVRMGSVGMKVDFLMTDDTLGLADAVLSTTSIGYED